MKLQARPSLEAGRVEEVLDANLLAEPCDMEVMLKMGQLGLQCTSQHPKHRPTMTKVWLELEEALHVADNFINKRKLPRQKSTDLWFGRSMEFEYSQSLVSIEGIKLEKFHVEMDGFAFKSVSLKCLEINSLCIDIDQTSIKQLPVAANDEQNKN